jgi:diguanylate cyclase (GGDEF)-like protein
MIEFAAAVLPWLFAGSAQVSPPPPPAGAVVETVRIAPRCFALQTPVVVDGDLSEWERRGPLRIGDARQLASPRGAKEEPWSGLEDASATLYLAFDDEALYVAGEVEDDDRVYDDRLWFNGDCLEIFLDTDREGDRERLIFDDDDFELCLMPYNAGRSWGVVKQGRRSVLADGGFRGVEVASRAGTGAGYSFEARLPFSNFGGFDRRTRGLALNVALIDTDRNPAEGQERAFLLLEPANHVYLETSGLLDVEFVDAPPRPARSSDAMEGSRLSWWLVEIAAALLLIGATARYSKAAFAFLERRFLAWKRALLLLAIAISLVLWLLPLSLERLLEARGREQFLDRAAILGRAVGGLAERVALGDGGPLETPEQLLALLRGEPLALPPNYEYATIELRSPESDENLRRSIDGRIPVRDYGVPLAPQRQYYFALPQPTPLSRVFVYGLARFEGAARERPGASALRDQGLEIGLRLADGRLRTEWFPVVDRSLPAAARLPSLRSHGPGYVVDGAMVEEYVLSTPTVSDALVHSIVVSLRDPAVRFALHGITTVARDTPGSFEPLSLSKPSLAGPPAAFFEDLDRGFELTATRGEGPSSFVIPVGREFDTLWFFYDSQDPGTLDAKIRGQEVGRFVVRDAAGHEHVAPLLAGDNLFPGLYDAAKRPSDTGSKVAFRWVEEAGTTRHLEMLELRLPERLFVEDLRFENLGPLDAISLYAVTGGRRMSQPSFGSGAGAAWLDSAGELRLAPDLAAALADCGLAVLVDDVAVACDVKGETRNAQLLGGRAPLGEVKGERGDDAEGRRIALFGEPFRVRDVPLARPDDREWKVTLLSPVAGITLVEQARRHGFTLALLLAVPLLVLYALDFATRIARLGPRLTTLLVATSLAPIVILFLALYNLVAEDRARLRESRAENVLREVAQRLEQYLAKARQTAEQIVASDALRGIRPGMPLDEDAFRSYLADVIAARAAGERDFDLAVRVEADLALGQRVRLHDRPEGEAMSRFDLDGRGVFLHWNRLVFLWTIDVPTGVLRKRVTVAGEIQPDLVRELSTQAGVEVALLAPDGLAIAGTRKLDTEVDAAAVERLRHSNRPKLRVAPDSTLLATQFLAIGTTEPAALMQIALPPDEFLVDALFVRLPLESFFFWFCAIGLAAAVFMGTVATARITGPIEQLELASRRIAAGELNVAVEGGARGEVGKLAESFNQMAADLRLRAAERQRFERALVSLNADIDPEPTATAALAVLCEQPPAAGCALYVRDAERDRWIRRGSHPLVDERLPVEVTRSSLLDLAARKREPLLLDEAPPDRELLPFERALCTGAIPLLLPLSVSDRCIGVAVVRYDEAVGRRAIEAELPTLAHLSGQIAVSLENAVLYRLAVADPETGLYVESFFRSRFAEEVDRAQRRESRLALILARVDGLRRLERAQGRDAARDAFSRIARLLKAETRDMVLVSRYGDGFALLAPETDRDAARGFEQQLLRAFMALDGGDFAIQSGLHLHLGVAVFPDDGSSSAPLFDVATRALANSRKASVSEALEGPQGALAAPEIDPHPYVFQSPAMKDLLSQLARVAQSNATVLLLGETGSGKEVLAELLHRFSDRALAPLVALNCSAVPENLLEAELFGYERGAFTGAVRAKPGQIELAAGGTLFLDEIGDLPLALQAKLLRFLQDHMVVRLGARRGVEVDVRVVAATNRDLNGMIDAGTFRADLYFRLKVVTLEVPPLRERREDIPGLVETFVRGFNEESGRGAKTMSTAALDRLYRYPWPGNVRELRNVVERALLMTEGELILPSALAFDSQFGRPATPREVGIVSRPRGAEARRGAVPMEGGTRDGDGLNERQRRLIESLEAGREIRSRDYFDLVQVPPRTGLRDLSELVDKGWIVRQGKRRGATYRLARGGNGG